MNIVIGKIGKSILFNPKKWSVIGGDLDAPVFYENFIHRNPDINFYILGRSDYGQLMPADRNRINKHGNVFDMYEGALDYVRDNMSRLRDYYKNEYGKRGADLEQAARAKGLFDYIEKVATPALPKIDAALIFSGPSGTSNMPEMVALSRTPEKIASPLVSLIAYAGPMHHYLNNAKVPHIIICTDPRYYPPRANDLHVTPSKVLTQFNGEVEHNHNKTYLDTTKVRHRIKIEYARTETIFLIGKEKSKIEPTPSLTSFFDTVEETSPFTIVLNEGRPSRYNMLKKYILDDVTDVSIYGKWLHKDTLGDTRFKGPKTLADLEEVLLKTKYTFMIPIAPGWVTAKFWEMIHYGIIPFMHPTYDTQNNLQCPDFLRVSSAAELRERIDYLENNPDEYDKLKTELTDMLLPCYYDGSYLNDITLKTIHEITK